MAELDKHVAKALQVRKAHTKLASWQNVPPPEQYPFYTLGVEGSRWVATLAWKPVGFTQAVQFSIGCDDDPMSAACEALDGYKAWVAAQAPPPVEQDYAGACKRLDEWRVGTETPSGHPTRNRCWQLSRHSGGEPHLVLKWEVRDAGGHWTDATHEDVRLTVQACVTNCLNKFGSM